MYLNEIEYLEREHIEREMHARRQDVLNQTCLLSQRIQNSWLIDFLKVLSSACSDGCQIANSLSDKLGLNQMDLFAISDDFESFEIEYRQILEERMVSSYE